MVADSVKGTAVGTDKTIVITGLPPVLAANVDSAGTYEVFIVAETTTGMSGVIKVPNVAITPSAPPAFTTAPTATASSSKGGQIDLTYTAAATEQVSYVVLAAATDAPADYDALVAAPGVGTNGAGKDTAGTGGPVAIAVSGLTGGTDYVVYWVIRTGSIESLIIPMPVTAPPTPAFTTAPTATASSSTVGEIDLTYTAETTERVSYLVLPSNFGPPNNYTQLMSAPSFSDRALDVAGTGGPVAIAVTGLTAGDYVVYWVIRTGSIESPIIPTPVTAPPTPAFTAGPTATASSSTVGEIDLTYTAAATEQVSYVVLAAATDAPTDYAILVAADGVGTNGEGKDTTGTGGPVAIAVTGLAAGDYVVYWVIRTGSLESPIIPMPVTVAPTPTFTAGPTATPSSSKGGQIDLTYTAGNAERVSYVVLASGATPPADYDALVAATGVGTNGADRDTDGTGSPVAIAVSGLAAADYVVYWVIRTGSVESPIISTPATAPATPAFTAGPTATPSSSTIGEIDLTYTAAATEQVSYVVLRSNFGPPNNYTQFASAPSFSDRALDVAGTGGPVAIAVSGLTGGTDYVVYWIIRTGSVESPIIPTPVTAPATPAFTAGPTATSGSKGGQIDLTYTAAAAEQVSYVVLAAATAATAAPTDYATLEAADGVGTNGEATDVPGTGVSMSIAVTGLTAGDYVVYWVIRTDSFESAIIRTPATGVITAPLTPAFLFAPAANPSTADGRINLAYGAASTEQVSYVVLANAGHTPPADYEALVAAVGAGTNGEITDVDGTGPSPRNRGVTDLMPGTEYVVYWVVRTGSVESPIIRTPATGVITTLATPTITDVKLQAGSETTTGFTVEYDLGGDGVTTADVYWAVQLADAGDIVDSGTGFTAVRGAMVTGDIVVADNATGVTVGTDKTIVITGLPPLLATEIDPAGMYEVFIVAETANGMSGVVKVGPVAITASATPAFTTAPTATASSSELGQIDLTYTAGSTTQVSYVVLESTEMVPADYDALVTATGVGTNGEAMDVAGTGSNAAIAVTGLMPGTEYVVYWVIRTGSFENAIIPTPVTAAPVPAFTTAPTATASSSEIGQIRSELYGCKYGAGLIRRAGQRRSHPADRLLHFSGYVWSWYGW